MNTITINDKTYSAPDGCSINVINMNIINNKVYVNGKLFEDCNADNSKKIEIKIEGNCGNINVDAANLIINGNVDGKVSVDAGNITCNGDIKGDVKCDCGKISCNNIFGNTDVDCGVVKSSKNSSECINNFIHKIFGE